MENRIARLDAYLASTNLESIWFATPPLFAWLTGGSNRIVRGEGPGIAAAGYDGNEVTLVTSNIEGQRLIDEEVSGDVRLETYPWYESDLVDAVTDLAVTPAAADFDVPGFDSIDQSTLTQPLTEDDIAHYRTLSQETARAVETVARDVRPIDTELEVAADLHRELHVRGIESSVVLVGGEDRVTRYRHFTPQDVAVGGYAILTVVGVRRGRHAAVTRTVTFDDAPPWLEERYADVCRVVATAAAATQEVGRTGGTAGDIFAEIQQAYTELGYATEWENHHQGGALGYASREWTASPDAIDHVAIPMAFGWNPTVVGAKSEDTLLVTEDGIEVLSDTGEFPTQPARAVGGDSELTLPGLLQN